MDEFGKRKCPALLCEDWTLGRKDSPDGPSRHIHRFCILVEHPGRPGHIWGIEQEVNDAGRPARVLR